MDAEIKHEFNLVRQEIRLEMREMTVSLKEEIGKTRYTFWIALIASLSAIALVVAAKI